MFPVRARRRWPAMARPACWIRPPSCEDCRSPNSELSRVPLRCPDRRSCGRIFVLSIVREKKLQPLTNEGLIHNFAAEAAGSGSARRRRHNWAITSSGNSGRPNVAKRRVDRMNQVEARVNQRAVKIEDHQFDGVRVECAARVNHSIQNKARSTQPSAFSRASSTCSGV